MGIPRKKVEFLIIVEGTSPHETDEVRDAHSLIRRALDEREACSLTYPTDTPRWAFDIRIKKKARVDEAIRVVVSILQQCDMVEETRIEVSERRYLDIKLESTDEGLKRLKGMIFPKDVEWSSEVFLNMPTPPTGHESLIEMVASKIGGLGSVENDFRMTRSSSISLTVADNDQLLPVCEAVISVFQAIEAQWGEITVCTHSQPAISDTASHVD